MLFLENDLCEAGQFIYKSVMKCLRCIKCKLKIVSVKDFTVNKICDILCSKIEQMWSSAVIAVVSSKKILQMVKAYAK